MTLSGDTRIQDLLASYPFLEDFLAAYEPRFRMLKNPLARATLGRVATLRAAAGTAGIDLGVLLEAIGAEIGRRAGGGPGPGGQAATAPGGAASDPTRERRMAILKEIIEDLHRGGDPERARRRFAEAVGDVEASEIAAMEEALIRGGLPVAEVQRLCDVHVGAFRQALDRHAELETPPGHPVHTYLAGNRVVARLAEELGAAARELEAGPGAAGALARAQGALAQLAGVNNHYQRKENQLFPLLERHGVTGPSQVMWGVHDEIRARLKAARAAAEGGDAAALCELAPQLARALIEMIYKEEKILFPMAMDTLSAGEWAESRRGEDVLGYTLAAPAAVWPEDGAPEPGARSVSASVAQLAPAMVAPAPADALELATGALSLAQVNLILTHLPLDLSFVDEDDVVRYYSEGRERIFPRSPAVIGRAVQNCHPPASLHVVNRILKSFRAGEKDEAEFWIGMQGRFVHIRYFAVRDAGGGYRGCLEVSQDVTGIRALEGERRLLAWDEGTA